MPRSNAKTIPLSIEEALPHAEWLQALPLCIIALTGDTDIAWLNHTAEQWFGASAATCRSKKLELFAPQTSPLQELLRRSHESREPITHHEFMFETRSNPSRITTLHLIPLPGKQAHTLLVMDDHSVPHEARAQESKREIARTAGLMAAMLAHEVKNPLSGIKGAAQLLQDAVREEDKNLAELIINEVNRITALLNQIELFSGETAYQTEPVNLHEIIHYAQRVALQGAAKPIRMTEQFDPSLPPIQGNREMLVLLFLNLFSNAIAAASLHDTAEIRIHTAYNAGGYSRRRLPVEIRIEDNGPGVPDGIRENLFEPFISAREGGKGLGLAIVAKIAADHQGTVQYLPLAQGSCFRVLLPQFAPVKAHSAGVQTQA